MAVKKPGKRTAERKRSAAKPKRKKQSGAPSQPALARDRAPQSGRNDIYVVGIGASAGGLEAFEQFFMNMPPDSGMAFVLVPHLSPERKSIMAELLERRTAMKVAQAEEGMEIKPDHVYIIPPNRDMAVQDNTLRLLEPSESRGVRHPIDFFFRSLARDKGEQAICIILSGTGTEGTLGLRAVKGEGGLVLAQDVKTARFDGMPSSAIATGLVDYILPPEKMPELLLRYTKSAFARTFMATEKPEKKTGDAIPKIFSLIRVRTGHDFSLYKQNTIIRRIEKRMALHQIETLDRYVSFLRSNEHEVEALANELLIRVTSFFRDPEAFEVLKQTVFPRLFRNKHAGSALRIWTPGCSTGEEAYSLAMTAVESMQELNLHFKVQIFATDIDARAIDSARAGVYPESITVDVSPERLGRFFISQGHQYQVRDDIREMVVFALQNVIKDPPFSKMDLICCRNLLIYLGAALQKRLLPLFRYALKPEGVLFLGSSETVGDSSDLFTILDKRWKIFRARKTEGRAAIVLDYRYPAPLPGQAEAEAAAGARRPANVQIGDVMEKLLIEKYAPPSCVVNDRGDILHFHGRTGAFLEPPSGRAALNVFEMAREGLRIELRTAIRKALSLKKDVVYEGLRVKSDHGHRIVNLEVRTIKKPEHLEGLLLVVFNEQAVPQGRKAATQKRTRLSAGTDERLEAMDYELKSTKEHLQSSIEELETSNEELKSLNEELQSSNEELQSTNEELETSREELQSVNEELITVNAELQTKIDELSHANNDIVNLLSGTQIATIFLDNGLRIKRFTPALADIVNIIQTDISRPLADIATRLDYPDLVRDAEETARTLAVKEKAVRHQNGRWYLARILPYRTVENVSDGAVVTFIDITEQKRAQALEDALAYTEGIVDTVRQPLLVLDPELRVITANRSFYRMFAVTREETEKKLFYELGGRRWDIPALRTMLNTVLAEKTHFEDYEIDHDYPGIGRKKLLLNARRVYQHDVGTQMILLAMTEVAE